MAVDYAAIAAKHIRKPGQKPPRILVYGRNKKGKTHLCTTAPNVLVLDPEDGTTFTREDLDVWPITQWTDLNEVYQALAHGIVSPTTGKPYDWVALDGCTRFANMALRYSLMATSQYTEERDLNSKPMQIQQRHYGSAGELFKGMVLNFHTLPQGLIFTAQERVEEGGDEDDNDELEGGASLRVSDMPRACRSTLNATVDVIGRIYTKSVTKTVRGRTAGGEVIERERTSIERRLWLAPHASYDTGFRSLRPDVPNYIVNPTIPDLLTHLGKGISNG